jgi:hypothetical protein
MKKNFIILSICLFFGEVSRAQDSNTYHPNGFEIFIENALSTAVIVIEAFTDAVDPINPVPDSVGRTALQQGNIEEQMRYLASSCIDRGYLCREIYNNLRANQIPLPEEMESAFNAAFVEAIDAAYGTRPLTPEEIEAHNERQAASGGDIPVPNLITNQTPEIVVPEVDAVITELSGTIQIPYLPDLGSTLSDEELQARFSRVTRVASLGEMGDMTIALLEALQEYLAEYDNLNTVDVAAYNLMLDEARGFIQMNQAGNALTPQSATSIAQNLFNEFDVNSRNGAAGREALLQRLIQEAIARAELAHRRGAQ